MVCKLAGLPGSVVASCSALALMSGLLGMTPALAADPAQGVSSGPRSPWYLTGFAGYTKLDDYNFDFINNATGARFAYKASLDDGYSVGAAVGYKLNEYIRFEGEYAYSNNDFGNKYRSATFIGRNTSGDVTIQSLMANVWLGTRLGALKPYIGGGIGYGWVDGDLKVSNGAGNQFGGDDSGFAYQLGAGVGYQINNNLDLELGYRWKKVEDIKLSSKINGFRLSSEDFKSQTLQIGLTWRF